MKIFTRVRMLAVLPAALLLISACAGGMAGSRPDFHTWPRGTSVTYEMVTVQTMAISIPGGGEQSMPSTSSMTFTVSATGPRTFEVGVVDASAEEISDSPFETPLTTDLIGASGTITLDEQGLVIEHTGFAGNPYVDFLGAEAFTEQMLQVLFQYLPGGALAVGQEWTRTYNYPFNIMGIGIDFSNEDAYTCLEQLTHEGIPAWKIGSTSATAMSGGGDVMGTAVDMAMAGTAEGTTIIDAATGMILESHGTITMSGGISAQGMDIPMDMEMRITVTRK